MGLARLEVSTKKAQPHHDTTAPSGQKKYDTWSYKKSKRLCNIFSGLSKCKGFFKNTYQSYLKILPKSYIPIFPHHGGCCLLHLQGPIPLNMGPLPWTCKAPCWIAFGVFSYQGSGSQGPVPKGSHYRQYLVIFLCRRGSGTIHLSVSLSE